MKYSHHGAHRAQKRAIPPLIVDWLQAYGASTRAHGATKYFFDKEARRRLERDVGAIVIRRLADKLDIVAVISDDGLIVTAYHRSAHIERP